MFTSELLNPFYYKINIIQIVWSDQQVFTRYMFQHLVCDLILTLLWSILWMYAQRETKEGYKNIKYSAGEF